ncbi:MAG: flavodoxin family protein [Saprospiraceae bacterium]
MPSNKTLIIMGSSNSRGNTRKIVDAIIAKTNADFIDLNAYKISYFDYEHHNKTDDFVKIATLMVQYEQIIFATPVYWYTMSAQLKTFFDRMTDLLTIRKPLGRQLRSGKKMFSIACSSDSVEYEAFHKPFKGTAEYLGMEYGGHLHSWVEKETLSEEVLAKIDLFCEKII